MIGNTFKCICTHSLNAVTLFGFFAVKIIPQKNDRLTKIPAAVHKTLKTLQHIAAVLGCLPEAEG